jgi:hypothetical protein
MTGVWEPDPSWQHQPHATGPGSAGAWLAVRNGRRWFVKRLVRPADDLRLLDPTHVGYWRREVEVALQPEVVSGPGLVPPEFGAVEEDETGATVWSAEVVGTPPPGLFVARALGRFAAMRTEPPPWASRDLLASRLAMAEERGGWPTLARTRLAAVADALWRRRQHWLSELGEGPQGRLHGDAAPANLLDTRGDDVVAVDWQCFGHGPVGTDLGYFALSSREDLDVLLATFVEALGDDSIDPDAVGRAARITAVYTVLSRAEWALAAAARSEGALAGKFRHPAVAPHLRAVQRQLGQIEQLL